MLRIKHNEPIAITIDLDSAVHGKNQRSGSRLAPLEPIVIILNYYDVRSLIDRDCNGSSAYRRSVCPGRRGIQTLGNHLPVLKDVLFLTRRHERGEENK